MSDFVYLASQSPRRSQLLDQLGVSHDLLLADAQEDAEALEAIHGARGTGALCGARDTAQARRGDCAAHASAVCRTRPSLCADTTVALGRRILGKPADAAEAVAMLQAAVRPDAPGADGGGRGSGQAPLSGTLHLARHLRRHDGDADPCLCGQWRADGQGRCLRRSGTRGAVHHGRIHGSYSGIMGLPLFETAELLKQCGSRFLR